MLLLSATLHFLWQLLVAKLRPGNIDASAGPKEEIAFIVARISQRWPDAGIWLRADSGFRRKELVACRENHGVHHVVGLARNPRLEASIADELAEARANAANPRFIVTSLSAKSSKRALRDRLLRARRDGEPHQGMPA